MYSIITWLMTVTEYLQACSNRSSLIPLSKACLFLCLLAWFPNYTLDIFYGMFHRHFNSTCLLKPDATSSFPFLPFSPTSLWSSISLFYHPSSTTWSCFFGNLLRNSESQSSALIIILNAKSCQTMLQVLSFLTNTLPLCPFLPISTTKHPRHSWLTFSIITEALDQASMTGFPPPNPLISLDV